VALRAPLACAAEQGTVLAVMRLVMARVAAAAGAGDPGSDADQVAAHGGALARA
jgi:hypothetical protein